MPDFDLDRLDRFVEPLTGLFYLLMVVAFLATVTGSPGTGFFFLILGALAQVGRASIEETLAARGPARPSRSLASRTAQPTRSTSWPEK